MDYFTSVLPTVRVSRSSASCLFGIRVEMFSYFFWINSPVFSGEEPASSSFVCFLYIPKRLASQLKWIKEKKNTPFSLSSCCFFFCLSLFSRPHLSSGWNEILRFDPFLRSGEIKRRKRVFVSLDCPTRSIHPEEKQKNSIFLSLQFFQ